MRRYLALDCIALCLALFMVGNLAEPSQVENMQVSLLVETTEIVEHLPVRFTAVIRNQSQSDVEIDLWDMHRLPSVILDAKFDSPLQKSAGKPKPIDFGAPEVKIRGGESLRIDGYLQDYLNHLTSGDYEIPYAIRWKYRFILGEERGPWQVFTSTGGLRFRILKEEMEELKQFTALRMEVIQNNVNTEARRKAVRELTLIDHPSVVTHLARLKDLGFEAESVEAVKRFQGNEASEVLIGFLTASKNPAIIREAFQELEKREKPVPNKEMRSLLDSNNKWISIEALKHVCRVKDSSFIDTVNRLALSKDPDVRAIAEGCQKDLMAGR